jgi:hypothetical protein
VRVHDRPEIPQIRPELSSEAFIRPDVRANADDPREGDNHCVEEALEELLQRIALMHANATDR